MDDFGDLIHWSHIPQRFSSLGMYGWRNDGEMVYDIMDDSYAWYDLDARWDHIRNGYSTRALAGI